ncbi:hypothetical protein [Streptomyces virginiae]|nr:hypothetical protein [Streptomyces sp. CMAA1738]MEC4574286.1 hypothetical protein [Streptomyces sp. CMAA1738]
MSLAHRHPPCGARRVVRSQLFGILNGRGLLTRLFSYVTEPDNAFPVVTP